MSIYIHGMDMPTKENSVILITPQGDVWMIGDMPNEDTHLAKAKAISVSKHGRLIDADALRAFAYQRQKELGIACCVDALDIALTPTIIPASEEE